MGFSIFKFLKRKRLVSKGLACKKTRMAAPSHRIGESIESLPVTRIVVLSAFVIGLAFLIFSKTSPEPLQSFVIALLIFVVALAQLWMNHPETVASASRLLLVFGAIFIQLAFLKLILIQSLQGGTFAQMAPLLVPYALAPLILSVLLGRNHGLYAAVFASLWSFFLYPSHPPSLLVMSLICGFVAVYMTAQVRRRSRLIRAGVFIGIATWVVGITFGMIGPIYWEMLGQGTPWKMIGYQSLAALGAGVGTAILVSGILPMLESLFGITTDISWLEIADLNHPLLRQLSLEAPGTYHHSLAVANLAEAAAEKVGANPTICRVCAYFHDIGKLIKPEYFTENMHGGANPHDDLTPTMSALILIAHVKEGIDLAIKHKLNRRIIDVIRQHHGTTLVKYFYQRALRQQEDARLGGKIMNMRSEDIPEVKESSFRYPGPKPQTLEAVIISLADTVESASRAIDHPTPQRLTDLIAQLLRERIKEGQLDDCPITLRQIQEIGESFKHTLMSMRHSRIAYPKQNEKSEGKKSESSQSAA